MAVVPEEQSELGSAGLADKKKFRHLAVSNRGGCSSGSCGCGTAKGSAAKFDSGPGLRIETGPAAVAVRLRSPHEPPPDRFSDTDLPDAWDITAHPRIAAIVRSRKFQFLAVLPNQIIFWLVMFVGLAGTAIPGLNFGAAITWYVWFCLLFVMMVVAGRAWCLMCPFGGFGEWVQKLAFWSHSQRRFTLGLKLPERWAGYGALLSTGIFLALTWIEEYFNIAGPGNPVTTGWLVIGIVGGALIFFLIFERRTFCRYLCPLTSLIATVSQMGSVAGFRTRDREKCLSCQTKECMRGGSHGAGCPWYTWPGAAESNAYCGLCSECYKACPYDNIGLFLQKPMTSVVQPKNRRVDIGWTIAALWGLVLFQQINALPFYQPTDNFLNRLTYFPHYPNPVDYLGTIGIVAMAMAGISWAMTRAFGSNRAPLKRGGTTFLTKVTAFRAIFVPLMYGMIPVVGSDYFARQLPKFLKHVTRVPISFEHLWGAGSTHSWLYNFRLLTNPQIIDVQVGVVAAGTLGSIWALQRIARRELLPMTSTAAGGWGMKLSVAVVPMLAGGAAAYMYTLMNAAN